MVYSLGIEGEHIKKNRNDGYGKFTEIHPAKNWNYGLPQSELRNLSEAVEVIEKNWDGSYPWNLQTAPIALKLKGVQIPDWKLINSAPIFPDPEKLVPSADDTSTGITLVPYGCTTLRITEFPQI